MCEGVGGGLDGVTSCAGVVGGCWGVLFCSAEALPTQAITQLNRALMRNETHPLDVGIGLVCNLLNTAHELTSPSGLIRSSSLLVYLVGNNTCSSLQPSAPSPGEKIGPKQQMVPGPERPG